MIAAIMPNRKTEKCQSKPKQKLGEMTRSFPKRICPRTTKEALKTSRTYEMLAVP